MSSSWNHALRLLQRTLSACRPTAGGPAFSRVFAAAAALLSVVVAPVAADEIILKNGKIIEGSARRSGDRVIIQPLNSDASIVLKAERIEAILPKHSTFESHTENASPEDHALTTKAIDAANTVIERPPMKLDPSVPAVKFTYEPTADAQIRAAVESVFPRIMSIFADTLGIDFDEDITLNIRIFEDVASFEAYKNQNSDLHYAVEGYYAVEEDSIVVRGNEFRQRMVATIYHEGTHAVLRREFSFIPSWIDEGLAEFFEGFRVHGNSTVALSPLHNDEWAKRFLHEGSLIPLPEYLQLTNHEWVEIDQTARHMPRIMAWSLVSFLMSSEEGRHALRRYLQALKRSTPTEALATAYQELDSAYRGGIPALEREWKSWVLEQRKAQTY